MRRPESKRPYKDRKEFKQDLYNLANCIINQSHAIIEEVMETIAQRILDKTNGMGSDEYDPCRLPFAIDHKPSMIPRSIEVIETYVPRGRVMPLKEGTLLEYEPSMNLYYTWDRHGSITYKEIDWTKVQEHDKFENI